MNSQGVACLVTRISLVVLVCPLLVSFYPLVLLVWRFVGRLVVLVVLSVGVFVFPGPLPWPWHQAPTLNLYLPVPNLNLYFYQLWYSICVWLLFLLQLMFVIVTMSGGIFYKKIVKKLIQKHFHELWRSAIKSQVFASSDFYWYVSLHWSISQLTLHDDFPVTLCLLNVHITRKYINQLLQIAEKITDIVPSETPDNDISIAVEGLIIPFNYPW